MESGVGLQERLGQLQEATVVRSRELNELIVPLLDDQVFYMATGLRELGDDPAPLEVRGAEVEVMYQQALSAVDARGNLAGSLIADVVVQDDLELVETLEERFRAATAGTFRALDTIGDRAPRQLQADPGRDLRAGSRARTARSRSAGSTSPNSGTSSATSPATNPSPTRSR